MATQFGYPIEIEQEFKLRSAAPGVALEVAVIGVDLVDGGSRGFLRLVEALGLHDVDEEVTLVRAVEECRLEDDGLVPQGRQRFCAAALVQGGCPFTHALKRVRFQLNLHAPG